ncbi:MAG: AAA-like domain-containing protein [Leptolyngbyaceae cyanobacterium MO_188.B28]|nr:AAA-like domain-containing protein [Leptolyngbyaceae cyanobacterium MO_188.B28]
MVLDTRSSYTYHVGGSLGVGEPSYVERRADQDLYDALLKGQFCYVFNARQTGKSSLRVRMKYRLKQAGFACASIDVTSIGNEQVTLQQWYKGVASELLRGFDLLEKVDFKTWWREQAGLSPIQKLSRFIQDVLLTQITHEKLFIFIDEVDSVLSARFSLDDFFALIRFFYNQRSYAPKYRRLTFALFGVAVPSDLIQDRNRTPFNIGRAIELAGFEKEEARPLLRGFTGRFDHPEKILAEILKWTGGQPFLTQKLCRIVVKAADNNLTPNSDALNDPDQLAAWIASLVQAQMIENWESQDDPEHLRTIRDRLLRNPRRAGRLLGVYQAIVQHGSAPADDSPEQVELQLSGLVVKRGGKLTVRNLIYQAVFNQSWLDLQFAQLRPYAETLEAWLQSNRLDDSRLLRGQSLQDAQAWADSRSLSDLDYQFLAASQALENQAKRQAEIARSEAAEARTQAAEARTQAAEARTQAAEVQLAKQKAISKWQRIVLATLSMAFAMTAGLAVTAYRQYRRAIINEIQAIVTSSKESFASERALEAFIRALQARRKLNQPLGVPTELRDQVNAAINQAVFGMKESNELLGHDGTVYDVAFSPDGQLIASASRDNTVKLWRRDGALIKTLDDHRDRVQGITFSPDGTLIASASQDGVINLWELDGTLATMLEGHSAGVNSVAFSPDGEILASGSDDNTLKLWRREDDGQAQFQVYKTLKGHSDAIQSVAFSPNGELVASGSGDGTIKLWRREGALVKTLEGHGDKVNRVVFSPDGKIIASGADDKTIKLWSPDGALLNIFRLHNSKVEGIAFSPDGQTLASVSNDDTIRLWRLDGVLLDTLVGHSGGIRSIVFSPDAGEPLTLASAGEDSVIHLWSPDNTFLKIVAGHEDEVEAVVFSPDGDLIATASDDQVVKLWRVDGSLITALREHRNQADDLAFSPDGQLIVAASEDNRVQLWDLAGELLWSQDKPDGHTNEVEGVAFSPDGQLIASASNDKTIKLWRPDGTLINTLTGHTSRVEAVAFSPDGQLLASASGDHTIKLWRRDGTLVRTLEAHRGGVGDVAFNSDGQLIASAGEDKTVKLWRRDGTLIRIFEGHRDRVRKMAFSKGTDQEILASAGGDHTLKLWHLDGALIANLPGHTAKIEGLDVSPNGQFIVSGSDDGQLIFWDLTRVLNLDQVLAYGCQRVQDYLQTNVALAERDRHLCDGVPLLNNSD